MHDVATHCTSVSKKLRSLPGSYSVVCFPLRKKTIILLTVPILLCFMCMSRSLYITSGIVVLWWTQVRWLCFPPLRALSLPEDPAINSIWCVLVLLTTTDMRIHKNLGLGFFGGVLYFYYFYLKKGCSFERFIHLRILEKSVPWFPQKY